MPDRNELLLRDIVVIVLDEGAADDDVFDKVEQHELIAIVLDKGAADVHVFEKVQPYQHELIAIVLDKGAADAHVFEAGRCARERAQTSYKTDRVL